MFTRQRFLKRKNKTNKQAFKAASGRDIPDDEIEKMIKKAGGSNGKLDQRTICEYDDRIEKVMSKSKGAERLVRGHSE